MDSVGILQKRTCSEEIDLVRKLDFGRQLDFARAAAKSALRKRGATHGRPIDLAGTAPAPDTFRKNSTSRGAERGAENAHAPCHVIGRQPTSGCFRTPPEAPPRLPPKSRGCRSGSVSVCPLRRRLRGSVRFLPRTRGERRYLLELN